MVSWRRARVWLEDELPVLASLLVVAWSALRRK
jgi:hypothetical protein